jgi:hypothetical protein
MIEKLEKDLEEKTILEDFDIKDRDPNAEGGLTRTSYAMGKGPVLPSDEDPINPFQPKPTGPVLPDKMASAPDIMDDLNQLSLIIYKKPLSDLTDDEYDNLQELIREKSKAGGLAGIINL